MKLGEVMVQKLFQSRVVCHPHQPTGSENKQYFEKYEMTHIWKKLCILELKEIEGLRLWKK